ncbi:MAG TPA: hypothetical protein VFS21_04195 [Roseiflexaceae bacterium]|nr:hypothetical protein [Roseiflexaceae bacterium]
MNSWLLDMQIIELGQGDPGWWRLCPEEGRTLIDIAFAPDDAIGCFTRWAVLMDGELLGSGTAGNTPSAWRMVTATLRAHIHRCAPPVPSAWELRLANGDGTVWMGTAHCPDTALSAALSVFASPETQLQWQ